MVEKDTFSSRNYFSVYVYKEKTIHVSINMKLTTKFTARILS